MKRKNLGLLLGLLVVLGAGAGLVVWQGGSAEGLATGRSAQADRMWTRLIELRDPYLDDWLGAFDKKRPAPMDVLEAWNEVALQVTGPGGFWRRQVPDRWMGCQQLPDSAACATLSMAVEGEFRKYDGFMTEIHEMKPRGARRYLSKRYDSMMTYLDHYVPADLSSPAMQKTPFFEKGGLAEAMRSDGML